MDRVSKNVTSIQTVLRTTRPSFLILSPVCVLLGLSTALQQQAWVNVHLAVMVFTGAVLAHISVNTLNEYHDFKSGLDLQTVKTPFSGGSGALPSQPNTAQLSFIAALAALLATVIIGVYLVVERGMLLLPIGFLGVALVLTYTRWLNRMPFLCLIAPGLGFGVLMVAGTHVVIAGEYSRLPWLVSLVPFFLMNNLLLLNQYPDINADSSVGRRTFPIVFGTTISNTVYALFFLTAYALVLYYICAGYIPALSVLALFPVVFSLYSLMGAIKYASMIGSHSEYLAANVAAALLTPALLAAGIMWG